MTDERPSRPIPEADDASRPFFEGGFEGKLMLMRCSECRSWRLPARQHCDNCLSDSFTWEQASGLGSVRTYGVMHQKYHPGFETPYNVTIVELDEGPRLPTTLVGIEPAAIRVGMRVAVDFEKHDDVALPQFRPA